MLFYRNFTSAVLLNKKDFWDNRLLCCGSAFDRLAVIKRMFCLKFLYVCFTLMLVYEPGQSDAYKPVVIMHGLFDKPSDLSQLENFIQKVSTLNLTQ